MKDETLIRMLEDACKALEGVSFPVTTPQLVPSYNALLATAQINHPNDPFLQNMERIAPDAAGAGSPEALRVLFGQLRIVLESYQEPRQEPR